MAMQSVVYHRWNENMRIQGFSVLEQMEEKDRRQFELMEWAKLKASKGIPRSNYSSVTEPVGISYGGFWGRSGRIVGDHTVEVRYDRKDYRYYKGHVNCEACSK